ncbi:MAG: hypothetical protein LCH96_15995 [Actinobacteria bacterium]|nr:hypothetical protein [Actinomycetota bacterium]
MDLELRRAVNATLMPGFAGSELPAWLATELEDGLGSVCLFSTNIVDGEQLRTLTTALHAANPDVLVATDEEGGDVTRLHHRTGSPYPSMAYLGSLDDVRVTERVGHGIGRELRAAGIDLNLAPDADVNSNPRNPVIGVRSFGADQELVARHVAACTRGIQSAGTAACAKHFPGHGDTATDSHLALPTITASAAELAARELVPFGAAVDAGTLAVMTSHILVPSIDPELPATLSGRVLRVLREDLGFTGAIVSDALDMAGASRGRGIPEAAVLALAAGVDLLCIGTDNTADQLAEIREHILAAVQDGRLPADRVFDAASRVAALVAGVRELRASGGPGAWDVPCEAADVPVPPTASRRRTCSPAPETPGTVLKSAEIWRESGTVPRSAEIWRETGTVPRSAEFWRESGTDPDDGAESGTAYPDDVRTPSSPQTPGGCSFAPLSPAGFWLRGPIAPLTAPVFLRLRTATNIAAGEGTPWGVGEHLRNELNRQLPGAVVVTAFDLEGVAAVLAANRDRPLVVQGRDLARVEFLVAATAMVHQRRPDALLVDLGWPELPGDPPIDIATFGSGRGAASGLIALLAEGTR